MVAPRKVVRSGSVICFLFFDRSSRICSKSGTRFMLRLVPSRMRMPPAVVWPETVVEGMPSVAGLAVRELMELKAL
jgi:hypothetical protein